MARVVILAGMTEPRPDRRLRLFVAVDVPAFVRRQVSSAAAALRAEAERARWTEPQAWHLTLAFLGWVHPSKVEAIGATLQHVTRRSRPFTLTLDGRAGTFGRRVLWVGIEHSPELARLASEAQQALAPLGFPAEERPFHAHLTLARSPRDVRLPHGIESRYRGPRAAWEVTELALMRSELQRSGAQYATEQRFPLGA